MGSEVTDAPRPTVSAEPPSSDPRLGKPDAWVAVAFAVLFAAFVAVSWQKWALLTADSARELYVPFQILHGKRIYEDFYYMYGPVAPVFNAGLLTVFGARLEVLYVASLLNLAAVMGLLYTLARHLLKPAPAAAALFLFFSHFALGRDIWGYAWPYAFAATYSVTLGLFMLVSLARFMATGRHGWLVAGGVAIGLSTVTKLEYGFAAAALGAIFLAGRGLLRRYLPDAAPGLRGWGMEALALVGPAMVVAGAIAGSVLARVPVSLVLESVWPVTLMKMWGSAGSWHGTASSWLANAKWLVVDVAVVGVVWGLALIGARSRVAAVGAAIALVGAVWMLRGSLGFYWDNAHVYWMGPGFLLLFAVVGGVMWRIAHVVGSSGRLDTKTVLWGLLAAYGCLVAARTLMTGYNDYTRYQAPVALVAWVAAGAVWLPAWLRARGWAFDARIGYAGLAVVALLLGERHFVGHARMYLAPHVPVTSSVGTVLAEPAFGEPFNAALAHVRANIRPGEAIVAAPIEASFYLFTGIDNVLMEDQLFYGYLPTPESQAAAIRRMGERQVRFVLVSNYGFGHMRFGETFMRELAAWLKAECRVAAVYGTDAYRITVYETPFAGTLAR
jgi:hypothetical protein